MKPILLVLAVAGLALAPLAQAQSECETEEDVVTVGFDEAVFYVYADDCTLHGTCFFSVWVFQESNGEPGLQRGDDPESDCEGDAPAY